MVEDEHKKAEKERMTLQIDAERKKAEEREAKKKPEKESSKQFEQKKLYDQVQDFHMDDINILTKI